MSRSQFPRVPVVWTRSENQQGEREYARYPHVRVQVGSLAGLRSVQCLALIDTGAATSVASTAVVVYGRKQREIHEIFSATDKVVVNTFKVRLRFEADPVPVNCVWTVPAIDLPEGNGPHGIILGRDFLFHCRFYWHPKRLMRWLYIDPSVRQAGGN